MYVIRLRTRSCKLLRDFEVSFVNDDGSPRMWTVFVGENGLCKTTLLRALGMTAVGRDFSNNLVSDAPSFLDKRAPERRTRIRAEFALSSRHHLDRRYPDRHEDAGELRTATPPLVYSAIGIDPPGNSLQGGSQYRVLAADVVPSVGEPRTDKELEDYWGMSPADAEETYWGVDTAFDVIGEIRQQNLPLWFAAGYGIGRVLTRPLSAMDDVPARDRMKSLFDPGYLPIGTGFADHFALTVSESRSRAFSTLLREALIDRIALPRVEGIELRGQTGASNTRRLIESHRFVMRVGRTDLRLPAIWLSQGYQAIISLVADIIGHVWLEAGNEIELDDMEGLVLVDELDLHLHPTWQTTIVSGLRRAFPRMQFVVTTHSPMILAGCARNEVWILRQDAATGDVAAEPAPVAPALLTAAELYRDFFALARGMSSALGLKLQRYTSIASNPLRSDEEDAELDTLRSELERHLVEVDYQPVARRTVP